jgi:hypothetical protein
MNVLKCGCEVREGRLLSVCAMHANYTRQHVEKARASRPGGEGGVDKELQRQLVVAIAPIVVSRCDSEVWTDANIAEAVHSKVHEIMRRMD